MHRTLYDICAISLLAVDEDAQTREVLTKLLPYNYGNQRIIIASDYSEAHNNILGNQPDILIVGLGDDVAKAVPLIREFKSQAGETRVIVVSTNSRSSSIDQCIAAGANGYVLKPINIEHFYSQIDNAIESIFLIRVGSEPHLKARLFPLQEQSQQ